MAFEEEIHHTKSLLMNMGLNEYQATALTHLMLLGETKATTLSKASGLPSARIYEVLDQLSNMGLITIRPGRPTLYKPRSPQEVSSSLVSSSMSQLKQKLRTLEEYAEDFTEVSHKIYLQGQKGVPRVPLLRIVSVGQVSLQETQELYSTAQQEILVLSRAMEYLPEVEEDLHKALTRGVSSRIILMTPSLLEPQKRKRQAQTLEKLREEYLAGVQLRFSDEVPIRGCIIDPQNQGGKSLFLVEDPGVPFFLREAAITSHPSVVKGLALMFDLMWEYKSEPDRENQS